jgi:hypothetical protein
MYHAGHSIVAIVIGLTTITALLRKFVSELTKLMAEVIKLLKQYHSFKKVLTTPVKEKAACKRVSKAEHFVKAQDTT